MNQFDQPPKKPESKGVLENSVEKEKFLERFIQLIESGKVGFAFSGKIKGSFNVHGVNFSSQEGGYHEHHVGKFLVGDYEDGTSLILKPDAYRLLKEPRFPSSRRDDDFLPDELIMVGIATREVARGTKTEMRQVEKKGIFGKKIVSEPHEVPNKVQEPFHLSEILENGNNEEARVIFLTKIAHGADTAGRVYVNCYRFFVDNAVLKEIFGTEGDGGLLRKYPDLLVRLLQKLSPELVEDGGFVLGQKRRTIVLEKGFGKNEPYNSNLSGEYQLTNEILQKIRSGEVADRILEYIV